MPSFPLLFFCLCVACGRCRSIPARRDARTLLLLMEPLEGFVSHHQPCSPSPGKARRGEKKGNAATVGRGSAPHMPYCKCIHTCNGSALSLAYKRSGHMPQGLHHIQSFTLFCPSRRVSAGGMINPTEGTRELTKPIFRSPGPDPLLTYLIPLKRSRGASRDLRAQRPTGG